MANFMNMFSKWDGWDIFYGVLTGGISAFVKIGVQSYQANKEAERAQAELEKISKLSSSVTTLPYLKGASNSVATGQTQPFICGTHLFTPYILNGGGNNYKGYSTISGSEGETQFYNVVLQNGFNNQILEKIYCDDITLKNLNESEPQEGKFFFDNSSVFASPDSFMEVAQDGNAFEFEDFNKKIVEQTPSAQLYKYDNENYEDLYYTLEKNSRAADVCIMFNGLRHTTSAGVPGIKTRYIYPSFSLDYAQILAEGGDTSTATWHKFGFQIGTWIPTAKTTVSGIYKVTAYSGKTRDTSKRSTKNWALSYLDQAIFQSGTDCRATATNTSIKYGKFIYDSGSYKCELTFTCSKDTVIEGHWTDERITTNTISGNVNRQVRFNAHVDFDAYQNPDGGSVVDYTSEILASEYPITIKVSTPDTTPSDGTDTDETYIEWLHSYCYDERKSNKAGSFIDESIIGSREAAVSCLLGLHIESTTANENKLKSIQVVSNGLARVWDSESKTWSTTKTKTDNAAAWWLEIMTSDKHTASKVADSEIDLEAVGKWFEFCDENDFSFDYVISDGATKKSILEMILDAGHAAQYKDPLTGKFTIAIDCAKETTSALLNEQNLVSFNYEKSFARNPDGVKITYINAREEFQEDSFVMMYERYKTTESGETIDLWEYPEERAADCTLTELTLNGVEDYDQAMRECLFRMKCANLRLKTATAQVTNEYYYLRPLDKVLVSHPTLKVADGSAEINALILDSDSNAIGAELYNTIDFSEIEEFESVIQISTSSGYSFKSVKITAYDSGETLTKKIKFVVPIGGDNKPQNGDVLSYGTETTLVSTPWSITSISRAENGFTLTLAEYNEEIYSLSDTLPTYVSHLTVQKSPVEGLPSSPSVVGVTIDKVAEVVEDAVGDLKEKVDNMTESPFVYTDISTIGVAIDSNDSAPQKQQFTVKYYCRQGADDLDFYFVTDDFVLPSGVTYAIDGHSIIFTVAKGTTITTETIKTPIMFTAYKYRFEYGDENSIVYQSSDGSIYGVRTQESYSTEYELSLSVVGINGGRYLGAVKAATESEITFTDETTKSTDSIILGDYFTWSGTETESELVDGGKFYPSALYSYVGSGKWETDTMSEHLNGKSLADVLNVADENLSENNSQVYEFVNHLSANSIFAKMLVSNEAFIENLFTSSIKIENYKKKVEVLAYDWEKTPSMDFGDATAQVLDLWGIPYIRESSRITFENRKICFSLLSTINQSGEEIEYTKNYYWELTGVETYVDEDDVKLILYKDDERVFDSYIGYIEAARILIQEYSPCSFYCGERYDKYGDFTENSNENSHGVFLSPSGDLKASLCEIGKLNAINTVGNKFEGEFVYRHSFSLTYETTNSVLTSTTKTIYQTLKEFTEKSGGGYGLNAFADILFEVSLTKDNSELKGYIQSNSFYDFSSGTISPYQGIAFKGVLHISDGTICNIEFAEGNYSSLYAHNLPDNYTISSGILEVRI